MNGSSRKWPDGWIQNCGEFVSVGGDSMSHIFLSIINVTIYAHNISPFAKLLELLSAHVLISKASGDEDLE